MNELEFLHRSLVDVLNDPDYDALYAKAEPGIRAVQATTFPWHFASLGVIRRVGMVHVGSRDHDTLGELLVFERARG